MNGSVAPGQGSSPAYHETAKPGKPASHFLAEFGRKAGIPPELAAEVYGQWHHHLTLDQRLRFGSLRNFIEHAKALHLGGQEAAVSLQRAITTAKAFAAAIDALPVGRDIRGRLAAHLDEHVASLEALVAGGAR